MNLRERLNRPLFARCQTTMPLRYRLLYLGVISLVVAVTSVWAATPRPDCSSPVPVDRFSPLDAYAITLADEGEPMELAKAIADETGLEAVTLWANLRRVSVAATERQIVAAQCHAAVKSIEAISAE